MGGFVYILATAGRARSIPASAPDIAARMVQHKAGTGSKFCGQYGIDRLVCVEPHEEIIGAIAREKAIKKWERAWKIALIEQGNSDWRDLWFDPNR